MPKYLFHGSYTPEGVRGLLKERGSSRRAHCKEHVGNLGGKLEAFYFAFGGEDLYAIVDLPDNTNSAAFSMSVAAGGAFRSSMIVLLTPEEVDQAAKKAVSAGYRPPGQSR